MSEQDSRFNYRELPATVSSEEMVVEIDTTLAEVEESGQRINPTNNPYIGFEGWFPPD